MTARRLLQSLAVAVGFAWHHEALLQLLLVLMALDVASGLLRAHSAQEIKSDICYRGMKKKAGMLLVISMAEAMEHLGHLAFPMGPGIALMFSITEAISIVENAALIGVPIPPMVEKALIVLQNRADDDLCARQGCPYRQKMLKIEKGSEKR